MRVTGSPSEGVTILQWALFEPPSQTDCEQFKRTVVLIRRLGEWFAVLNEVAIMFSDSISHWECDLIPVHAAMMDGPDVFNPFAFTYEQDSNNPYATFSCDTSLLVETQDFDDPYDPYNPQPITLTQVGARYLVQRWASSGTDCL